MRPGSLWKYYRDKIDDVDNNASDLKLFKQKTKVTGKTEGGPARSVIPPVNLDEFQPPRSALPAIPPLNTEVTIPLKYLSNAWRSLNLPLINCEVDLDLKWSKNCVLIEENDHITSISFIITSTKLEIFQFMFVVTLSINGSIKFLENKKQGFKRTIFGTNIDLK